MRAMSLTRPFFGFTLKERIRDNISRIVLSLGFLTAGLFLFEVKKSQGQEETDSAAVSRKLEEVLGNQKTILAELSAIREEVRIIKIRVTQAQ